MSDAVDLGIALAAISLMVAWLLIAAWIDFSRPRHALTWAMAFCCFGGAWLLVLCSVLVGGAPVLHVSLLSLPPVGTGLMCFAFHQRAGHTGAARPIMIAIAGEIAISVALFVVTGSFGVAILPYTLLNAAACWYASASLVGRRQGERTAERLTYYWLRGLGLFSVLMFGVRLWRALHGASTEPLVRLLFMAPVLPAILTGLGLFAILLLTADLADQSRRLAGTDMLTGLLNRRGFDDAATAMFGSVQRNDRTLCLAVVDIDRFKDVNDRFGHLAGDEVLRRFAACLAQHVGPRDILARIGGEEFALILPDSDCEKARLLLERARDTIAECPLDLPGDHRITASFGVAARDAANNVAHLFAEADRALYVAKSGGRNRVVVAD